MKKVFVLVLALLIVGALASAECLGAVYEYILTNS